MGYMDPLGYIMGSIALISSGGYSAAHMRPPTETNRRGCGLIKLATNLRRVAAACMPMNPPFGLDEAGRVWGVRFRVWVVGFRAKLDHYPTWPETGPPGTSMPEKTVNEDLKMRGP